MYLQNNHKKIVPFFYTTENEGEKTILLLMCLGDLGTYNEKRKKKDHDLNNAIYCLPRKHTLTGYFFQLLKFQYFKNVSKCLLNMC